MARTITNVGFSAGFVTLTYDSGPAERIAIREFLEGAIDSDDYVDGSIDLVHLAAASIDGTAVKLMVDDNVIGNIPLVYQITIADASASTDVTTTHKIRILDFWIQNTGAAAHATTDTIQLLSTAAAITDALKKTDVAEAIIRAATIDQTNSVIAAGGKIRITASKTTNVACIAYVLAVRTA